jgi:outer membrane receptor for monomeric catechols
VRAAGDRFEQSVGSAVMDLADAAEEQEKTRWSRLRREYAITVREGENWQKLLKMGYKPDDRAEAREIMREVKTAYTQFVESNVYVVHVVVTYVDGVRDRFRDLRNVFKSQRSEEHITREQQERRNAAFDFAAWKAAGCPPADEWSGG